MVLVKILGGIDCLSAAVFLCMIFGIEPWLRITLFCAGLLLMKGLFVLTGDVLSVIDIFASIILLLSLAFTISTTFLWIPAFLLLAKGLVSFL